MTVLGRYGIRIVSSVVLFVLCMVTGAVGGERARVPLTGERAYENATLNEDVIWKGTVVVRGNLVVAPQATLRIEPGTVVRFVSQEGGKGARLVVQGRLLCSAAQERPALLTSEFADPKAGDWGGVLLAATEKKNLLEHCRIEGALIGVDARFSTLAVKGTSVSRCGTGVALHDSTAVLASASVSTCDTALESYDSEVELTDGIFRGNKRGVVTHRSGVAMSKVQVTDNETAGFYAEECRLKISGAEFSGNTVGVLVKGGEGQIAGSRFIGNRQTGLHLAGTRLRIQRSRFFDNARDGLRVEDGRSIVSGSVFGGKGGYYVTNAGNEPFVAVLNWWGGVSDAAIRSKLSETVTEGKGGTVVVTPWLTDKPAAVP